MNTRRIESLALRAILIGVVGVVVWLALTGAGIPLPQQAGY